MKFPDIITAIQNLKTEYISKLHASSNEYEILIDN